MVYNTYTFGETPEVVLNSVIPDSYRVELKNKDAELVNLILFNKETRYLKTVFNKTTLIKLLNSLKSIALGDNNFWSVEEADLAFSLRSSILLTLGIEEL